MMEASMDTDTLLASKYRDHVDLKEILLISLVFRPNYGLLVRPKKVTVRGINASDLIPDGLDDVAHDDGEPTHMISCNPNGSLTKTGNNGHRKVVSMTQLRQKSYEI